MSHADQATPWVPNEIQLGPILYSSHGREANSTLAPFEPLVLHFCREVVLMRSTRRFFLLAFLPAVAAFAKEPAPQTTRAQTLTARQAQAE